MMQNQDLSTPLYIKAALYIMHAAICKGNSVAKTKLISGVDVRRYRPENSKGSKRTADAEYAITYCATRVMHIKKAAEEPSPAASGSRYDQSISPIDPFSFCP